MTRNPEQITDQEPADTAALEKINACPEEARNALLHLRDLIFETAAESVEVTGFKETLKWGQPSYVTESGSTVRIHWQADTPDQCYLYCHCQTRLIETFKELYQELFEFQGNRAIVVPTKGQIPTDPLKHCISMALQYHRVKHLPMLGA